MVNKIDVHDDNNDTPTTAYCLYWLVIVYSLTHTRLLYVVYISYTSMAYHWRIHHLIFYTALVNPSTPLLNM